MLRILAILVAVALSCVTASAQDKFPSKPIHIILTNPPGGTVDTLARAVGEGLRTRLNQPVVIVPKPGANGNIAAETVLRAPPDGYTLLLSPAGPLTTNALIFANTNFDPQKAFAPVALVANAPLVLVVNAKLPIHSVAELIDFAKKNPGKLSFSSQGFGATGHLAMEMLKSRAGIDMAHITYPGSAQAMLDLIGGRVDLAFDNTATSVPHIQSGQLRAIAVAEPSRLKALPDVPTMIESGLSDFVASPFFGVVAPAGTPAEIIQTLNTAIVETLSNQELRENFAKIGVELRAGRADQFAVYLDNESRRWGAIVKAAGIQKR
jgi:tripartite-type tricarboxylate transporter receptor subunit TctC